MSDRQRYTNNNFFGQYGTNFYNVYEDPNFRKRQPYYNNNFNQFGGNTSGARGNEWYQQPRPQLYHHQAGRSNNGNFKFANYNVRTEQFKNANKFDSKFANRMPFNKATNYVKDKKALESEPTAVAFEESNESEKECLKKVEEDKIRLEKLFMTSMSRPSVSIDTRLTQEPVRPAEKKDLGLTLPTLELTESDYKEIGALAGHRNEQEIVEEVCYNASARGIHYDEGNPSTGFPGLKNVFNGMSVHRPDTDQCGSVHPSLHEENSIGITSNETSEENSQSTMYYQTENYGLKHVDDIGRDLNECNERIQDENINKNITFTRGEDEEEEVTFEKDNGRLDEILPEVKNICDAPQPVNECVINSSNLSLPSSVSSCTVNEITETCNDSAMLTNSRNIDTYISREEEEQIVGYIDRQPIKLAKDNKSKTQSKICNLYRNFLRYRWFEKSTTVKDKVMKYKGKDASLDNPYLIKNYINVILQQIASETQISTEKDEVFVEKKDKKLKRTKTDEKDVDEFMENYGHLLDDNFTIPCEVLQQLGLRDEFLDERDALEASDDERESEAEVEETLNECNDVEPDVPDSLNQSCENIVSEHDLDGSDGEHSVSEEYLVNESSMNETPKLKVRDICKLKDALDHEGEISTTHSDDGRFLEETVSKNMKKFIQNLPKEIDLREEGDDYRNAFRNVNVGDYFNCVVGTAVKTADSSISDPATLIIQTAVDSVIKSCDVSSNIKTRFDQILTWLRESTGKNDANGLSSGSDTCTGKDVVSEALCVDKIVTSTPKPCRSTQLRMSTVNCVSRKRSHDQSISDVCDIDNVDRDCFVLQETNEPIIPEKSIRNSSNTIEDKEDYDQVTPDTNINVPEAVDSSQCEFNRKEGSDDVASNIEQLQEIAPLISNSTREGLSLKPDKKHTTNTQLEKCLNSIIKIEKKMSVLNDKKWMYINTLKQVIGSGNVVNDNSLLNNVQLNFEQSMFSPECTDENSDCESNEIQEAGDCSIYYSIENSGIENVLSSNRKRHMPPKVLPLKLRKTTPSKDGSANNDRNTSGLLSKTLKRNIIRSNTMRSSDNGVKEKSDCIDKSYTRSEVVDKTRPQTIRKTPRNKGRIIDDSDDDVCSSVMPVENVDIKKEVMDTSSISISDDPDSSDCELSVLVDRARKKNVRSLNKPRIRSCFVNLSVDKLPSNLVSNKSVVINVGKDVDPKLSNSRVRACKITNLMTDVQSKRRTRFAVDDLIVPKIEVTEPVSENASSTQDVLDLLKDTVPVVFKEHKECLYVGCEDGRTFMIQSTEQSKAQEFLGHSKSVYGIDMYDRYLVTGSSDGLVIMHRITGKRDHFAVFPVEEPVQTLCVKWQTIFVGTKTGKLARYSCVKKNEIGTRYVVAKENANILAMCATKEGPRKILIVSVRGLPLFIRDATSGLLLRSIEYKDIFYSLSFYGSTPSVYCGTRDNSVVVINFTTGQVIDSLVLGKCVIKLVIKWNLVFTASYDGFVHIYNLLDKKIISVLRVPGVIREMEIWNNKVALVTSNCGPLVLNFPDDVVKHISKT